MNEKQIFEELFKIARSVKDPKGVVSACLTDGKKIIAIAVSAENGIDHAEKILLSNKKFSNPKHLILYSTLEPCSKRSNSNMKSCSDYIIESGIKKVIYAAKDHSQSLITKQKFKENNIILIQVKDKEIIKESQNLFNNSVADIKDIKKF